MDNIEKVPNRRLWCSASKYKLLILSQVSGRLPHQKQEIKKCLCTIQHTFFAIYPVSINLDGPVGNIF